jgi:alanine-glyoxylate transaminase/serine-glyoxylate transaminase/serine-pyruvate transaminase
VLEGYESRSPGYFSTPPTTLVAALRAGLDELLSDAGEPAAATAAIWRRHDRAASALRAAWESLGLKPVPVTADLAANTLSALHFPTGRGNDVVQAVRAGGVVVAGGLHRDLVGRTFRIGHMGHVTRSAEPLERTVRAVAAAVTDPASETVAAAADAFTHSWSSGGFPD